MEGGLLTTNKDSFSKIISILKSPTGDSDLIAL